MWKAYYGEVSGISALIGDSIPDKHHFVVNGYANAWYIDKTGTYTITLYFKPQSLLVLGSIISALSIILSIVGIIYIERNKFAKFLKFNLPDLSSSIFFSALDLRRSVFTLVKARKPKNKTAC
jgi:hypothetical protein